MKKFKVGLFGLVALLVVSGLSGCGSAEETSDLKFNITEEQLAPYKSSPLTISFWNSITGPDSGYLQNLVGGWNKKYGNIIKIANDSLEESDYYTRIATSINDNDTADLCFVHESRLSYFVRKGAVRDMTALVKTIGIEQNQYIPEAWNCGVYDGKLCGLPYSLIPTLLWYNKNLIPQGYTEADILSDNFTYEKMFEMMKAAYKHHAVSGKRTYGAAFNYAFTLQPFLTNLYGLGDVPIDPNNPTEPIFNNANGFAATKKIEEIPFVQTSEGYYATSESGVDHRNIFAGGRALFTFDGIWSSSTLVYDDDKCRTGLAFMPKTNENAQRLAFSDAVQFVTFKNKNVSDFRDGAIKLIIKYFVDNSTYWCKSGKVATRLDTAADSVYTALPWSFFTNQLGKVKLPQSLYTYEVITNQINIVISEICEGKDKNKTRFSNAEIQQKLDDAVDTARNLAQRI